MAMGFSDVLWVFLMVTALQPILKQKLLEMRRLRLLVQLEKRRGSRVIALVHRQETMSFLGFPLMRYIDVNDSEEVLRAIKLTDTSRPSTGGARGDRRVHEPLSPADAHAALGGVRPDPLPGSTGPGGRRLAFRGVFANRSRR